LGGKRAGVIRNLQRKKRKTTPHLLRSRALPEKLHPGGKCPKEGKGKRNPEDREGYRGGCKRRGTSIGNLRVSKDLKAMRSSRQIKSTSARPCQGPWRQEGSRGGGRGIRGGKKDLQKKK